MIRLAAALLACLVSVAPQEAPPTRAEVLERWRESLLLDLPGEVLEEAGPRVAPGGGLEHDGEALALHLRARFETGTDAAELDQLFAAAEPDDGTRGFLELERARCWIEQDELERAARHLQDPRSREPRFAELPESWLLMGRALSRAGGHDAAAPFLETFLERAPLHPEAPAALHMLAQRALRVGELTRAQGWLDRAGRLAQWHAFRRVRLLQVREAPGEPLPRLGLAQLWLEAGQYERAREVLERLLARSPDYARGWFHLAEAERALGRMEPAFEGYSRALEHDPQHVLARYNRAVIHLRAERNDEARADLEALVDGPHSADPRALGAHLALARLLAAQGEPEAAVRRHARYVELGGSEEL